MARREEIIHRIRKALGRPLDGSSVLSDGALPPSSPLTGILPIIPPEELLPKFEAELTKVAGIAHRAANRQGLEEILRTILSHAKATSVVLSRNPLLAELNLEPLLRAWGQGISVWQTRGEHRTRSGFAPTEPLGAEILLEPGTLPCGPLSRPALPRLWGSQVWNLRWRKLAAWWLPV